MLQRNIVISSFDVFPNGTVKPSALLRYFQQLAREDCDAMGCTYSFMREHNTVFVLTRLGLALNRPVYAGERITVRTYNNQIHGLSFVREYELAVNGEAIGHCTGLWVLIRFDTRAPVRPRDFPFAFECCELDCPTVEVPRRFAPQSAAPCGTRVVRVSDLDENNHLNNCVYADIAVDHVGTFNGLSQSVHSLKIIFHSEARLGETLHLSGADLPEQSTVVAENETTGKRCFEAEMYFFPEVNHERF